MNLVPVDDETIEGVVAIQVVGHRFDPPFDVAHWCEQAIRLRRP